MTQTTKPLEKITAHFRNKISGNMSKIFVKEWDTTIYFKPVNTLSEEGKLIELAQQGKTVEALVETLIMKARNEDGTKMFAPTDRLVFMNEVDPQILIRVVGEMNIEGLTSLEDVEKN